MAAIDCDQGTPAWKLARAGFITASRIGDVMAKPRKGQKDSVTRRNYRAQLVSERLTGKSQENDFQTWDMKRGIELEPFARAEYELKKGMVNRVGFVVHPKMAYAGCSPDGIIGSDGLVQFKAPKTAIHLDYIVDGIVPVEYRPQMYFEMGVTGRQWNDFCSYEPSLPPHLQLFVARLMRDEVEIQAMEEEVKKFNEEIMEIIELLPRVGDDPENLTSKLERSLQELKK